MKVCLIGSLNNFIPQSCGQITKTQLYYNILKKEFVDIDYYDLSSKKIVLILFLFIKFIIKKYNLIVALPGPRACHYILPLITKANKNKKCRIVYSAIGVGYFDNFMNQIFNKDYKFVDRISKKDVHVFQNLDACLFESEFISYLHKKYYHCKNSYVITNFRDFKKNRLVHNFADECTPLRMLFVARVCSEKGVLDLISVVNEINNKNIKVKLDIYGSTRWLNDEEFKLFNSSLNNDITYKGYVSNNDIFELYNKYDIFCYPTKFLREGVPGSLVEALIAGMPIISSNFIQAAEILTNKKDSLIYKFDNKKDLKNKIMYLYKNRKFLDILSKGAYKTGREYIYSNIRQKFLKILTNN